MEENVMECAFYDGFDFGAAGPGEPFRLAEEDLHATRKEVRLFLQTGGLAEAVSLGCVYENPNGFIAIPLDEGDVDQSGARLHLWPQKSTVSVEFHDHPWDFSSIVLAGGFLMWLLVQPGKDRFEVFKVHRPSDPLTFLLEKQGKASGRVIGPTAVTAGNAYHLPWHWPHRIESGPLPSLSLVVRRPYQRRHSSLYIQNGQGPVQRRRARRTIALEEAESLTVMLQDILDIE